MLILSILIGIFIGIPAVILSLQHWYVYNDRSEKQNEFISYILEIFNSSHENFAISYREICYRRDMVQTKSIKILFKLNFDDIYELESPFVNTSYFEKVIIHFKCSAIAKILKNNKIDKEIEKSIVGGYNNEYI